MPALFQPITYPAARRPWATAVSFLVQASGVAALLLAPMLRTAAVPALRLAQPLPRATRLAQPASQWRAAAPTAAASSAMVSYAGPIRQPRSIPRGMPPNEAAPPVSPGPPGIGTPSVDTGVPAALLSEQAHLMHLPIRIPAAPTTLRVSQGVMQGYLVERVQPEYPTLARQARVQGTVVLEATISKTGHIENVRVTSGHPLLSAAAVEAVQRWRYRPYMLNGEAVEVSTSITVVFTLDGG